MNEETVTETKKTGTKTITKLLAPGVIKRIKSHEATKNVRRMITSIPEFAGPKIITTGVRSIIALSSFLENRIHT